MTPKQMILEWRKGCSCSVPGKPEQCQQCTRALIDAIDKALDVESKDGPVLYDCNICGGRVDLSNPKKPTVHIGPGGKHK